MKAALKAELLAGVCLKVVNTARSGEIRFKANTHAHTLPGTTLIKDRLILLESASVSLTCGCLHDSKQEVQGPVSVVLKHQKTLESPSELTQRQTTELRAAGGVQVSRSADLSSRWVAPNKNTENNNNNNNGCHHAEAAQGDPEGHVYCTLLQSSSTVGHRHRSPTS